MNKIMYILMIISDVIVLVSYYVGIAVVCTMTNIGFVTVIESTICAKIDFKLIFCDYYLLITCFYHLTHSFN